MSVSKKWKIALSVTFIISLLSVYALQVIQFESSHTLTKGWAVNEGDAISFEAFVNSNSPIRTIVDDILDTYEYEKCEPDVWGYRNIKVAADETPTDLNITQVALEIVTFTGPVKIKQYIDGAWKERTGVILPFFVPVGFWDELLSSLRKVINGNVSRSYSWVGEYTYVLSWMDNITTYTLVYTWDEKFGTLQAAIINATVNGNTDSFEIHLNNQNLKAESLRMNDLQVGLVKLALISGIFSFPATVIALLGIRHKEKKHAKKEKTIDKEEISQKVYEILRNWDETKRNYILLWFGVNFLAFVIGFSSFLHLIYGLGSSTSKATVYLCVFFWVFLAASLGLVTLFYKNRFAKYALRYKVTGDEIFGPLVSYIVGFLSALLFPETGMINLPSSFTGRIILIGLFIILLLTIFVFYIVMNPWRDLNKIRMELESNL